MMYCNIKTYTTSFCYSMDSGFGGIGRVRRYGEGPLLQHTYREVQCRHHGRPRRQSVAHVGTHEASATLVVRNLDTHASPRPCVTGLDTLTWLCARSPSVRVPLARTGLRQSSTGTGFLHRRLSLRVRRLWAMLLFPRTSGTLS